MKKWIALSMLVVIVLSLVPVSATPALACGEEECGCTLTQRYWKTHSKYGPAPYDAGWISSAYGEDMADWDYRGSGYTFYQVLNSPPKGGNAWFILAAQHIATQLTWDSGRVSFLPGGVYDAWFEAETLLATYSPDAIGALKGNDPVRKRFLELAGILDNFNNGNVPGYPHCS